MRRAIELSTLLAFAATVTWLLLDHGLDLLMRRLMAAGGIRFP